MDVGKSLNPAIDIGQVCDDINDSNAAILKVQSHLNI